MSVELPPLTEGEYTQTLAALDERAERLSLHFSQLKTEPPSNDRDKVIDYVVEALHWTNTARLTLSEADPWSEGPRPQTWTAA